MRTCEACGASLDGSHPKKRFCDDTCRKRGARGATVTVLHGDGGPDEAAMSVAGSTRTTLSAAGRLGTPAGAAALVLAQRLDRGGDTGSAMASMVRELRAAVAEAMANAEVKDDAIDELRKWREERQQRAVGN